MGDLEICNKHINLIVTHFCQNQLVKMISLTSFFKLAYGCFVNYYVSLMRNKASLPAKYKD